ncbi:5-carboxymethyl-2-hydroxymuconate Delta-isomerase [Curvibacter sp. CHRR-16]|uniref:5-carboxymethyl-2-hydroxymuconate Delta-isomerase n=1 Tax=Curvibacter sp. CHRR-16 TaxID=2835872 RepID=UPI001BD9BCAF|nr:5-carboxymethyl-2-hydroxymuconate Delta-isomerase [Curvibacter sp. CHRR-16]MBT0570648.1 5-carboxymethyl-2-hydroxymuconate Delta-isomerase [Curvibacter sp. CHRR-16]
MPHLTIEVSENLRDCFRHVDLLASAHQAVLGSGIFEGPDVKSRLVWREHFLVGRSGTNEGFAHASLALLSGRTQEQCDQLANGVVAAIQACLPQGFNLPLQVSCEVREMNRNGYAKAVLID